MLLKPGNILRLEIGSGEEAIVVDLGPTEEWKEKPQWDLRLLGDTPLRDGRSPLQTLFDEANQTYPFPTEILNCLRGGTRHHKKITFGDCWEDNGHITYPNTLYVPDTSPYAYTSCRNTTIHQPWATLDEQKH